MSSSPKKDLNLLSSVISLVFICVYCFFIRRVLEYVAPDLPFLVDLGINFLLAIPVICLLAIIHRLNVLESKIDKLMQESPTAQQQTAATVQHEQPIPQPVAYQNAQVSQEIVPSAPNPPEQ